MITPNKYFFEVVEDLNNRLDNSINKEELFEECVKNRLISVLEVQSKCFDEELKSIDYSISWDLSDIKNIKRLGLVLSDLHKVIAVDRLQVISNLINLCK